MSKEEIKNLIWLATKMLTSRKTWGGSSALLAFLGLVIGVACLVASMAVVSGFESTLKNAMIDVTGHLQVIKRAHKKDDWQELTKRIQSKTPGLKASMRFVFLEAVVAKKDMIQGVVVQGVDSAFLDQTLNLKGRLQQGQLSLKTDEDGIAEVLVGKGLAAKLDIPIGGTFKVVVPIAEELNPSQFRRHLVELRLAGILDLGKNDFNDRFILSDISTAQAAGEIGEDSYNGLFLRYEDADQARAYGRLIADHLGASYWVRDWYEVNESLFRAVGLEKVVIFFVVLIIVLVAAFNVASSLYISMVQRYADIAILKSIGLSSQKVKWLFSSQGLMVGFLGLLMGTLLGFVLCWLFMWGQEHLGLINGAVYRVDRIDVQVRFLDWFSIAVATLGICFLTSIGPASQGAKRQPAEGLRYG